MRVLRLLVVFLAGCMVATGTLAADPIQGKLLNPSGSPIVGATVALVAYHCKGNDCVSSIQQSATTGEDGSYALPEPEPLGDVAARVLVAYKKNQYFAWSYYDSEYTDPLQRRDLNVVKLKPYSGKIRTASGSPAPDAKVTLKQYVSVEDRATNMMEAMYGDIDPRLLTVFGISTEAVTNPKGVYIFPEAPEGFRPIVKVQKPGFTVQDPCKMTGGDQVIISAFSLSGRVLDLQGKPLEGVSVTAHLRCVDDRVKTGTDGVYRFTSLPPGEYSFFFFKEGSAFKMLQHVKLKPGKPAIVPDAREVKTVAVTGKVVDPAGKGVQGVQFRLMTEGNVYSANNVSVTDDQGRFTVRAVPGRAFVSAFRAPSNLDPDMGPRTITVPKDGMKDFTIKLKAAFTGSGKVVDMAGNPVPGASVSVLEGMLGSASAPDGSFSISLPSAGYFGDENNFTLTVRHNELGLGAIVTLAKADLAQGTATITLKPYRSWRLYVKNTKGKPISGARVSFETVIQSGESTSVTQASSPMSRATDATGMVQFSGLFQDIGYHAKVTSPGLYDIGNSCQLDKSDTQPKPCTITLYPGSRTITGKVIDDTGKSVAGVQVRLDSQSDDNATVTTDKNGRFALKSLPDTTINLNANKQNAYGNINVKKGINKVVIVLQKGN